MSDPSAPPPRPTRPGVRLPALLSTLALASVIAGIGVGHYLWRDLRASMSRMDRTLESARARQQEMVEHFSRAQTLLLAQQRKLQEAEEDLRARQAALAAERAALADREARARWVAEPKGALDDRARARDLARRLDLVLAGLADPGGLAAAGETLGQVAQWAGGSSDGPGASLGPALERARDALASAGAQAPARLSQRIEALGARIVRLAPGRPRAPVPYWTPGLAGFAGPGHLGVQLENALLALHRGDLPMFRLSLDTAAAWLDAFYDPSAPAVAAVRRELLALRGLPVRQDLAAPRAALLGLRAALGKLADGDDPDGDDTAKTPADHPPGGLRGGDGAGNGAPASSL